MNDFRVLLQAVLDSSGIGKSDIAEVQKVLNKYHLNLAADLNKSELIKTVKQIVPEIEAELKKITGIDIKINETDLLKAINQVEKDSIKAAKAVEKIASESQRLSKINSIKTWADNNSKAMKEFGGRIDGIITKMSTINLPDTEFKKLNAEFEKIKISARDMNLLGKTWGDSLKDSVNNFGSWLFASGGVMTAITSFKKMKDASVELNGAITDLAMATGASKKQLESYIETYSKLSDELSSTVTDVTVSATEWLKQGKSIADTNELIRDSIVLSKVGNLSPEDSTKYLTSAMKGYKVSVEDTLSVVDKLSAVDMASATDVGGLAEGMSEVASNADLAGISMDKLLGYLATVGEVTQEGMSSVGTSFNAIFSRMGNIKLSRLKDYQNNGEDLSNVETVLRGEGINLRDSQDSFRNFGDVLDEVAGKWNSFSEVSQHAIASAFAGTNHLNEFIVLMENYSSALDYTETSLNSSGEAMGKFADYEKSVAGHTERFKNAFIGLSDTVVNSDILNYLIDLGTLGVKGIDKLVESLGGFGTIAAGTGIAAFVKNYAWV